MFVLYFGIMHVNMLIIFFLKLGFIIDIRIIFEMKNIDMIDFFLMNLNEA